MKRDSEESAVNQVLSVAYVALGSNLGDREGTLRAALRELDMGGTRVRRCSSFHETTPVGGPAGQGMYFNAVAEVETSLTPRALLERLLAIEAGHGRMRGGRNAPRTLDLDLLLYDERRIEEPGLSVPHPRMWEREFVLKPLGELCDVDALRRRFGA